MFLKNRVFDWYKFKTIIYTISSIFATSFLSFEIFFIQNVTDIKFVSYIINLSKNYSQNSLLEYKFFVNFLYPLTLYHGFETFCIVKKTVFLLFFYSHRNIKKTEIIYHCRKRRIYILQANGINSNLVCKDCYFSWKKNLTIHKMHFSLCFSLSQIQIW